MPALFAHLRTLLIALATCFCCSNVCGQSVKSKDNTDQSLLQRNLPEGSFILAGSKSVSLRIPLEGRHAISISGEYLNHSSLPMDFTRAAGIKPEWKVSALPFTVSYSYSLSSIGKRIHPIVGAGVTGLVYKMSNRLEDEGFNPFVSSVYFVPRNESGVSRSIGVGYGAEVFAGFRTDLNDTIFLLTQCRYRYLQGRAVVGETYSNNPSLGLLDFSVGIGFTLR